MTEVIDHRQLDWNQSQRAAQAYVVTQIIRDVISMIYRAGADPTEFAHGEPNGVWHLRLRNVPTLRIQIRIVEPTLYQLTLRALQAFDYKVRDKDGDHLVVIV